MLILSLVLQMAGVGVTSSFQKKGKLKVVNIPGARPSIHNSQLLLSTGVPSLDYLLGGGLPVGSILLLEQDRHDVYSKLFLKYYLAEGVMNKHMLGLASLDVAPQLIMQDLPASAEPKSEERNTKEDTQMTIAWRYQNQVSQPSACVNRFGHNFDLTKSMDKEKVSKVDVLLWDGSEATEGKGMLSNKYYWSLLQDIKRKIDLCNLSTSCNKAKTNVLRLGVHSLGSPLWGWEFGRQEREHEWHNLTAFMTVLRAIVRNSFSVCLVTVPSHLFTDPALLSRLHTQADFVVRLESFQGSDKEMNPVFKDYHGLFHVVKLGAINCLVPPILDTTDWVFRLKRQKLIIERLHLPPELSETVSRSQEESLSVGHSCMGNKLPKHLDF